METDNTHSDNDVLFRKPSLDDGYAIYSLIENSPPLDVNSSYLYFLQSDHFSDTCVVAEKQGKIVGFISAFFNPKDKTDLFVWQVAVDASMRGQGLALRLLEQLVRNQSDNSDFARITATISPSNIASQKLFKRFSETHGLSIDKETYLEAKHFGDQGHEAEELYTLKSPDSQPFKHILFKH
ncbi:diaminobutyrate acetyltransferase [Thiomicrorhabdus sp. ZW0627]|uniref:diaminobutyrate acetyltransferase n=1 Tax=Thiomicrorhabdus sp. ZW0627 TaxID=3039774 RepID=UPI002436F4A5|nr:diaminobutyrate acetyltransferase [Thiomicrorhabdus sp. ZW0627]MDG6773530.1 diaminobutyrate acetyltransferase [Thiomicrorhabdus sp. ZW0627]